MIELLKKEDYVVSDWSGGKTEQIYICPPNADYAKRNFLYRISSATVRDKESDFTFLQGTKRYITILSGDMKLTLPDKVVELDFGDILEFSGEDNVHCEGQATDFNLMLKGAEGWMDTVMVRSVQVLNPSEDLFVYAHDTMSVVLSNGAVVRMDKGDCCHIYEEEGTYSVESNSAKVIIVKVKR